MNKWQYVQITNQVILHLFTLTNQLFNKLLWLCSLYACTIYVCTYSLSSYSFLFCVRVFWYSYFREGNPFYETRLNFQVSILLSQRGSPINSGDLVRYWADPARHVHWVEAGMLQIGLLAPFHWKKDSHWLPFGFENMLLYVPGPPHTVHSTITTENEDLHAGLIYKHTKGPGCCSASQYEVCYWFAGYETHYWCFIIPGQEFLRAKPVGSRAKYEATRTNTKLMLL